MARHACVVGRRRDKGGISVLLKRKSDKMAKIIAVANQKGGTGKTTTSTCLAGALQLLGKKALLVDCDAQCNATDTYGAQTEDVCTLFDVMTRQGTVEEGIQHCEAGDILPSDNALKDIDEQLVRDMGKNFRLREALESVSEQYDYIVLDTPPQLGLALVNALIAANSIIVPITADRYALAGLSQLSQTICDVRKYFNPTLKIEGLLLNQYKSRENLSKEVVEQLPVIAQSMGTTLLDVKIRPSMGVRKAQAERHSLFSGDTAKSTSAEDFKALAKMIAEGEKNE